MRRLRLALAQVNPFLGDFARNLERFRAFLARAEEADADLVIFPELALCGYPPEDLLLRSSFIRDNELTLAEAAAAVGETAALVGFAHGTPEGVFNAAALLQGGTVAGIYHKIELPNYGVFDEKRYFRPGTEPLLFQRNGILAGVTLCEDIWVERGTAECALAQGGVELVLNLSASPFHAGKLDQRKALLAGLAGRIHAHVGYVNLVGGQDELVFDGGSLLVDPSGTVVAGGRHFAEDLAVVELVLPGPAVSAPGAILSLGERSRTYRSVAPAPEVPERYPLDEIFSALVLGTRDYVRKNGFERVVVGLSGGIDSALVAAVAVEALGVDHVTGVTMPSRFSSAGTRRDAATLAANLGIPLLILPIEDTLGAYQKTLDPVFAGHEPGIEFENLQARIRGNLLMALSNRFHWMVLTTGNKSEMAVGYCTLYGDMAGGFAVIKDVPKTLVFELARHLNRTAGREIIPQSVLERAPSAELRADQKDDDTLPPYAVLDPILKAYVEEDLDAEAIIGRGFPRDTVLAVARLVDLSEYKRRQAPPGVKITPKAFGRDRRMPITNHYSDHRTRCGR